MNLKNTTWIKLGGGALFLLGLIFLLRFTNLRAFTTLDQLIALVESARINQWTMPLFYVGFIFGVMALPITIFPIVGGVLYPYWVAFPLNVLAATMGAYLSFLVSRFFGRGFVESFLKGKLKSFDEKTASNGVKTVFLLRFVGFPPFIVSNYALGLSKVNSKDFLIGTLLGIMPWMSLITYLAQTLWAALLVGGKAGLSKAILANMGPLIILSFVVAGVVGASVFLKKKKTDYSNL